MPRSGRPRRRRRWRRPKSGFMPACLTRARATITPAEAIEVTPIFLPLRSVMDLTGLSSRHGDAIDVGLVGGIEELRFHALRANDGQRLDRGQRGLQFLGGDQLDAVGRAGQGHEVDLDAVLLEPAELAGDGKRRGRRADGLGAPAHAHGLNLRGCGTRHCSQTESKGKRGRSIAASQDFSPG